MDQNGQAYVAGLTQSTDFPTCNAFQANKGGGFNDAFVTKLSTDGSILYSTYLGGGTDDNAAGIAVDQGGNAYIIGITWSANFPTTNGAFQTTKIGSSDAFVTKLDPAGALIYSTFLGGSGPDEGCAIAVDQAGAAYIVGKTGSTPFPAGATNTCRGFSDAFVVKLNADGSGLLYSGLLGGYGNERANGIAVDQAGQAYVAGETDSKDNWFSYNAIQPQYGGGYCDAFIAKIKADGSGLVYSTYLGGNSMDYPMGIAVDKYGAAYVTGGTESANFPTVNPLQPLPKGGREAFVSKITENQAPQANAGPNVNIASEALTGTVIQGVASDPDNDSLSYRWLQGATVLSDWQAAGSNGEAPLNLSQAPLPVGTHTLTLEVSDGTATASDDMILTINNSAPHVAPSGGGTYEIGTAVTLSGQVSDFDGDTLSYSWKEGTTTFCSGSIDTSAGGAPVDLGPCTLSELALGTHTISLVANDAYNSPVSQDIVVTIKDTQGPTLAPSVNQGILWPPNHKMVDIVIDACASDNSGGPVTLAATVASNEPIEGLGDGDMSPDWTEPVIDQASGLIHLQLRAERSGKGEGRVYLVSITATDAVGNSTPAEVRIIVPHDQRRQ